MTVKSCLNWRDLPSPGEINDLPSATVPDDALSIKEILDRYARGLPLGGERVPVYNNEELLPDFERMSEIERLEWLHSNADYISELKAQVQQEAQPSPLPHPSTHKQAELPLPATAPEVA